MSLSHRDRQMILDWIDGGCAEGDPADAPQPLTWPTDWSIVEPDEIITVPQQFTVPAEGVVEYQNYYVKTNFPNDRWISAMEIRPSQPQLVHHVLVFLEEPRRVNESEKAYKRRQQDGLKGYFARMAPGATLTRYQPGFARRLPAGAWLKFQVHYSPNGVAATDQIRIAFEFLDSPPRHEVMTSTVFDPNFRIPPGKADHVVKTSFLLPPGITLGGFTPHMHLRGKSFRYELEFPDRRRKVVCDVPRFDFNWQMTYQLAEPIALPEGGTLHCIAVFDNSANNPLNPDPSQTVRFGQQTTDEMMLGYFDWWR